MTLLDRLEMELRMSDNRLAEIRHSLEARDKRIAELQAFIMRVKTTNDVQSLDDEWLRVNE